MNYTGAAIVIIAALYIGISKANNEKKKVTTLRELCAFIQTMKNEVCGEKTSLYKFFFNDGSNSFCELNDFIEAMRSGIQTLGERRFCDIWSESVNIALPNIPEKAKNALLTLGMNVGRYDAEIQKPAFERCESILQSECAEAEISLKTNGKMYIGLGGCAGAVLALMLV